MDEAFLVGQNHDGQLVAGHQTAAGGLYLLNEERMLGDVFHLIGDAHHFALNHGVVVADGVRDDDGDGMQLFLARGERHKRHKKEGGETDKTDHGERRY